MPKPLYLGTQKLSPEEVERLIRLATSNYDDELAEKLGAALNSPPVEEREEQRVLTRFRRSEHASPATHPSRIPLVLERLRKKYPRAGSQVQSRTITTFSDGSSLIGTWSDLEGEGGDRGK